MLVPSLRYLAIIGLACSMTYLAGKDINSDLLNYHLYIAHAWSHSKYLTDFMGAGPNSYLNPLPYLPFYWMVMAGWHSLAIGLVLGAFHGINLIFLWEISERILFKGSPCAGGLALISVLLGASAPVFAGTLGGTFLEPTLTVFVLGGILLVALGCVNAISNKSLLLIFTGGLLMGLATGFKLPNIVFLAAAGLSLLVVMGIHSKGLAVAVVFSIGTIVGYLIANGWWSYFLYQEFHNPFFPFFNEIFQSSDFSPAKLDHDRFKPTNMLDVLILPFRMAAFHSWIYVENNAPDIRPALLVLFGFVLAVKVLIKRLRASIEPTLSPNIELRIIMAFFFCSVALWLWTTGNGRYALPVLLLIGPLLTFSIYKALANEKQTLALASTVLILQTGHAWAAGNPRWAQAEWTPLWFEASVPKRLKESPHTYLSLGTSKSNSVIAPFLHPESTFVSLVGNSYAFRPDGAGNKRIREIINVHGKHLRMLITIPPGRHDPTAKAFDTWDNSLAPWALKIIRSDCEFLNITLGSDKSSPDALNNLKPANASSIPLLSCALEVGKGEDKETVRERKRLTLVFDRIEESCPLLFSPRGWHLTKLASGWQRTYLQSDIVVYAHHGRLSLSKYDFGPFDVDMGSIEEWESNRSKFVCERLPRPW